MHDNVYMNETKYGKRIRQGLRLKSYLTEYIQTMQAYINNVIFDQRNKLNVTIIISNNSKYINRA